MPRGENAKWSISAPSSARNAPKRRRELVERRARPGAIEGAPGRVFRGLRGVPKELDLRSGLHGTENAEEAGAVAELGVRQRCGEQAPLARREPGELDTDPARDRPRGRAGPPQALRTARPIGLSSSARASARPTCARWRSRAPRVRTGRSRREPGSARGEETVYREDRAPRAERRRTQARNEPFDAPPGRSMNSLVSASRRFW